MQICSLFMLCGFFTSLLIPETKWKTLEELVGETGNTWAYELRMSSPLFQGSADAECRKRAARGSVLGATDLNYLRLN
jgi:PHS family inorganic phosphate transporter-like MFS transporter